MKFRIFISSVQREFAHERKALAEYIRRDAILGRFFDVFVFEEVLAQDRPLPKGMTLAKFYRRHKSYPANPFLAYAMFLVKYIEETGTGSRDVISLCEEAGQPRPKWYVEDGEDFRIVIQRPTETIAAQSAAQPEPINEPIKGELHKAFYDHIRLHPGAKRDEIVSAVGRSLATIKRHLDIMIASDPPLIEYRGSNKTGGYYPVSK